MMTQETQDRYYAGGDIYETIFQQYGFDAANAMADAAATGDNTAVNAALVKIKFGANLDTSTFNQFMSQITTDPLAAPLAGANNILGKSFLSLLKNPWVLVTGALVLFFALGGFDFLKRQLAKK